MASFPPKFNQIIALLLILLVGGCAQRETGVGRDAITGVPAQDFIIASDSASASAEWVPEISNGNGNSLQVGNASHFFAFSALRWDPAAALPDSYVVESVKIKLTTSRIWPSTSDTTIYVPDLYMIIREIPVEWEENNLFPGSLADYASYDTLGIIEVPPVSDDSIFFDLPLELWQKWVDESLANSADTTIAITSYGLLLEPANDDVMVEFFSAEGGSLGDDSLGSSAPVLRMEGRRWDLDDTVYVESDLFLEQLPEDDAYLAQNSAVAPPGRLLVAAGYPERALVYFPLDSLLQSTDRLIARAEFHVFADTEDDSLTMIYPGTGLNFKTGSITNSEWVNEPDSVSSVTLRYVGANAVALNTNDALIFDVTGIVSGWFADPSLNGGLQVQTSSESQFLSRQVFYSQEAEDLSKRPQLFIWYVEPSQ